MFAALASGWLYLGYQFYGTIAQIGTMLGGSQYFAHLGQTGAIACIGLISVAAIGMAGLCVVSCFERSHSMRQGVKVAAILMCILTGYYAAGYLRLGIFGLLFILLPKPYVGPHAVILLPVYMFLLSAATAAIAAATTPSKYDPKVITASPEYADTEPAAS